MALACAIASGCSAPAPGVRALRATMLDCRVQRGAQLHLQALRDAPQVAAAFVDVDLQSPSTLATLPADARAFAVEARDKGGAVVGWGVLAGALPYESVSTDASVPFDGALVAANKLCTITNEGGAAAAIAAQSRVAIGVSPRGVLIAGGVDASGGARAEATFVDPLRMRASDVAGGLLRRRSNAVVLALESGFVVAGGEDSGQLWSDAELLDDRASPRSFSRTLIALGKERAEAAGVVTQSGDGLLIGGRASTGPLATIEAIDATTLRARSVGLATLPHARVHPSAARLTTGEIVVAGGTDAAGAPVAEVTVLSPAADRIIAIHPVDAAEDVDVIALPSGSALLVTHVRAEPTSQLALVTGDGAITSLGSFAAGASPPRWTNAPDGAPLLFDGSYRRYAPWQFALHDVSLDVGSLPAAGSAPVAVLDGAMVLLVEQGTSLALAMQRFDLRGPLVNDAGALGLGSTDHLVPDRPLSATASAQGLEIAPGGRVSVADASFLAFSLRIDASAAGTPLVELSAPSGVLVARVGGDGCSWPPADAPFAEVQRDADGTIHLLRAGAQTSCALLADQATYGQARLSVTLVAGASTARARGITLVRR